MSPATIGQNATYYHPAGPREPSTVTYPPQVAHLPPSAHSAAAPWAPPPTFLPPQQFNAQSMLHRPQTPPPAYANALPPPMAPAVLTADSFTRGLEHTRRDINKHLDKHPIQKHAGRVITTVGTVAAIGGGAAAGVAVLAGAFGTLSGIGIPVAAAAALGGVGVGLAGIGLAALAGAVTRSLARRSLAKDPALQEKVAVLQEMRSALLQKGKLTKAEKGLLKDVSFVLGKVDGFKAQLKSQLKVAGKTTAIATVGVAVFALLAVASAEANNMFLFFGGPTLGNYSKASANLGGREGSLTFNDDDVRRWQVVLNS